MSDDAAKLYAPVVEVTLLEDRAHVVRRGRISLGAGPGHVVLDGLAPALSDKTLSVEIVAGPARVTDSRIDRRCLHLDADKP